MTSIVIAPRVEDLTSDTEAVASGGWFRIRPARAYKAGGQWVHPVWPASVTPLNGSAVTVKLDPIADVPYELELSIPDGNGGSYHPPNEFRYVTASASPLNWEDLIQEAGPGAGAPLPGSAEARLLALETLYSTLSGGASTLAGITDMTAVARTLNGKSSTDLMLTYLSAQKIGDAPTAHTHAVPGGLVATGTPSASTYLAGDGSWKTPPTAGSPAWTDVTGKPTTFAPTAHTHGVSDLTTTGTASNTTFLRGDGTWVAPTVNAVRTNANAAAGEMFFMTVWNGVGTHPLRPSSRTDIFFTWRQPTAPLATTGYALPGDEWEPTGA